MIMHGIYDHGEITILDKEKPDIYSNIEIIFLADDSAITEEILRNALKLDVVSIETKKWKFNRAEIYSHEQ